MEHRRETRTVWVGAIGVGSAHPVRIQSMTTSNTRDVPATVDQIMRLADTGCEIARVTVQGIKEAESCEAIKNILLQRGYNIPLVADIHFFPPAAMKVVDFVEKIRINPGNFVDKRASFKVLEYDEASYAAELLKLEEKFTPLIEKCKRLNRSMRIGTNHGSLSDRIMNRYGDTPKGMVEAAFEFAHLCRKHNFHQFLFSMKSSNPKIMIEAYRLLVTEMQLISWDYPLHLGVTEAGEGEDGRVKSAMGIGALLLDGIGDTIRVSLTEDAWQEIDPCQRLIRFTKSRAQYAEAPQHEKHRKVTFPTDISLHKDGSVALQVRKDDISPTLYQELGYNGLKPTKASVDCIIQDFQDPLTDPLKPITVHPKDFWPAYTLTDISSARTFFQTAPAVPIILHYTSNSSPEDFIIEASALCGSLLCDGLGNGLWLSGPYTLDFLRRLSFSILQAARMRSVKTDFISCPSCGRTLFDLQDVSKRIRARTEHLPGVKIAIMGCIVNGPGEMADADFGYVGSKPGMIDLYVGKTCVEKDIHFAAADERLVELIKTHGRWVELASLT